MGHASQDPPAGPELFPGWNTDYDLMELVRIIRPFLTWDLTPKERPADPFLPTKGSLLAGKKVMVSSRQTTHQTSNVPETHSEGQQVQTLTALTGSPKRSPVLLHWLMATTGALVLVALVVWLLMQALDRAAVATFQGADSKEIHLLVEPGETLPDFTGHLLVEGVHEWNDIVSTEDLLGKHTVMLVWGSWNAELPSWSQELNSLRLGDFDSSKGQFLGLNLDKSREDALAMLNEDMADWPHIFNYSQYQAVTDRPMQLLGIDQSPLILLIDSTGRLRAKGLKPNEVLDAYQTLFGKSR